MGSRLGAIWCVAREQLRKITDHSTIGSAPLGIEPDMNYKLTRQTRFGVSPESGLVKDRLGAVW